MLNLMSAFILFLLKKDISGGQILSILLSISTGKVFQPETADYTKTNLKTGFRRQFCFNYAKNGSTIIRTVQMNEDVINRGELMSIFESGLNGLHLLLIPALCITFAWFNSKWGAIVLIVYPLIALFFPGSKGDFNTFLMLNAPIFVTGLLLLSNVLYQKYKLKSNTN